MARMMTTSRAAATGAKSTATIATTITITELIAIEITTTWTSPNSSWTAAVDTDTTAEDTETTASNAASNTATRNARPRSPASAARSSN